MGLTFVLKSMTKNQREIIKIIAKYLLDHPLEKGITIKDLYELCVDATVATSQKGLKDSLNEAKDHKVVHEKTDDQGHQMLTMTYPVVLLEKIANDELN